MRWFNLTLDSIRHEYNLGWLDINPPYLDHLRLLNLKKGETPKEDHSIYKVRPENSGTSRHGYKRISICFLLRQEYKNLTYLWVPVRRSFN